MGVIKSWASQDCNKKSIARIILEVDSASRFFD